MEMMEWWDAKKDSDVNDNSNNNDDVTLMVMSGCQDEDYGNYDDMTK